MGESFIILINFDPILIVAVAVADGKKLVVFDGKKSECGRAV